MSNVGQFQPSSLLNYRQLLDHLFWDLLPSSFCSSATPEIKKLNLAKLKIINTNSFFFFQCNMLTVFWNNTLDSSIFFYETFYSKTCCFSLSLSTITQIIQSPPSPLLICPSLPFILNRGRGIVWRHSTINISAYTISLQQRDIHHIGGW